MKKILFVLILVVCLVVIHNLVQSIYNLWQKQALVGEAQQELDEQKKEHEQLRGKLSQAQDSAFIEEQARDRLFMARPREYPIFIPKDMLTASGSSQSIPRDTRPNWQKWWELFFE